MEQVGTCLCWERFLSCKFPVQLEVIMALMVSDPQLYLCTACVAWDCCQCVSLHCLGSLAGEPGKPAWRAWVLQASQAVPGRRAPLHGLPVASALSSPMMIQLYLTVSPGAPSIGIVICARRVHIPCTPREVLAPKETADSAH